MIEKMQKIQIVVPKDISKNVLEELADFACVDFQEILKPPFKKEIFNFKEDLELVKDLENLIETNREKKGKNFSLEFISFASKRIKELRRLKKELEETNKEIEGIRKIRNLEFSKKSLCESQFINFFVLEGEIKHQKQIQNAFLEYLIFQELFEENKNYVFFYGILKEKTKEFEDTFKKLKLKEIKIPEFLPKEKFKELVKKKNELESAINSIQRELRENLPSKKEWKELKKMLDFELNLKSILLNAGATEKFSFFTGWIPQRYYEKVKAQVERKFQFVFIEKLPFKPEDAPVLLSNKFSKIFEIVTKLYGLPKPTEIDPTPFLAPFFIIFFGFSLSDVGYGLLMILAGLLILLKIKRETSKIVGSLLIVLGFSTTIFGILFGTFFGKEIAMYLNPAKEPFRVLAICFLFATLQISLGYLISFFHLTNNGKPLIKALADNLSFVPILLLISFIFFGMALGKSVIEKEILFKFLIFFLVLKLFLHLIGEKNIMKGLLKMMSSLYNSISLLSDTLSYSRIYALGLATGVIAGTVNLIATIFKDMVHIPVLSFLVFVFVLIFGHLFSIVINIWGAFLHSARLQLVEFLSKFLEGGGRPFQPLTRK